MHKSNNLLRNCILFIYFLSSPGRSGDFRPRVRILHKLVCKSGATNWTFFCFLPFLQVWLRFLVGFDLGFVFCVKTMCRIQPWKGMQTDRQTDRQTHKQTDRQTLCQTPSYPQTPHAVGITIWRKEGPDTLLD